MSLYAHSHKEDTMWRKLGWFIVGLSLLGMMGCATSASRKGTIEDEPWYPVIQEIKEDVARLEGTVEEMSQETARLNERTANLDSRVSLLGQELRNRRVEPPTVPTAPRTAIPSTPATGEVQALYNDALDDYNGRYYAQAIDKFTRLILQHPQSKLADNAQYWLAECYYGLEDYPRAIHEFKKVFPYANTEKDDDAQLKLGFCYAKMGDTTQAVAEFSKLLNLFPDSEYTDVARMKIEELSP
jgi:tol-pal system protein YbgF